MSRLTWCDGCKEVVRCDFNNGVMTCDSCRPPEPDPPTEDEMQLQYLNAIDNPFQLECIDDEWYKGYFQ